MSLHLLSTCIERSLSFFYLTEYHSKSYVHTIEVVVKFIAYQEMELGFFCSSLDYP